MNLISSHVAPIADRMKPQASNPARERQLENRPPKRRSPQEPLQRSCLCVPIMFLRIDGPRTSFLDSPECPNMGPPWPHRSGCAASGAGSRRACRHHHRALGRAHEIRGTRPAAAASVTCSRGQACMRGCRRTLSRYAPMTMLADTDFPLCSPAGKSSMSYLLLVLPGGQRTKRFLTAKC